MSDTYWGIDLGGTKIEGVIVKSDGTVLARERIPTEAQKGYEHILSRMQVLTSELSDQTGIDIPARIGLCTPGALKPDTQTMKNCNTTCLIGRPFKADVESMLDREIVIENDANCFALAEVKLGAARGAKTCFAVIQGTGVGGGVVINDQILTGADGTGGEWGHNELIPDGPKCYCGRYGCVETVVSGPFLERYYTEVSGKKHTLREISELAEKGVDSHAVDTINRLVTYTAKGLSVVINILDPDIIVLGGGVSNLPNLPEKITEELLPFIFNDRVQTKIVKNELGDSAGVLGAAMLAA